MLTGSQQFGLLSGISQSLAGRVGILQLLPFSIAELRAASARRPTWIDCCSADSIPRCTIGS